MFQYHQSSSSTYHQCHQSYYKSYYEPYNVSSDTNNTLIPPPMGQPYRRTGRVKFFNVSKGYGFIIPTNRDSDSSSKGSTFADEPSEGEVFVHHTSILNTNKGFPVGLNKGEEVEYELHDGPKGIYALFVTGPKGRPVQCHSVEYQSQHQHHQQQEYYAKSVIAYHHHHHQQQQPFYHHLPPPPPYHQLSHHHHKQQQHQQQHQQQQQQQQQKQQYITYIFPAPPLHPPPYLLQQQQPFHATSSNNEQPHLLIAHQQQPYF